ncbi:putative nuclease HARBI1 [Narcine bancroftii]|uniref:putative nuclease HARBI1 n=1 Tax=Narcine bancroftii TaxID=1343680 RepID=UPI003831B6DF
MMVQEVTAALRKFLGKLFISLPSGTRLQETIDGFAQRGFPMCAGAIDGSYIRIITPSMDSLAYYNRKGWRSVVLQAVVDHRFCFSDVFVGWPGRTHDAQVLANSPLFRKAEDQGGHLFPRDVSKDVEGVRFQRILWVMRHTPYEAS